MDYGQLQSLGAQSFFSQFVTYVLLPGLGHAKEYIHPRTAFSWANHTCLSIDGASHQGESVVLIPHVTLLRYHFFFFFFCGKKIVHLGANMKPINFDQITYLVTIGLSNCLEMQTQTRVRTSRIPSPCGFAIRLFDTHVLACRAKLWHDIVQAFGRRRTGVLEGE
jgi:hypothetical protein